METKVKVEFVELQNIDKWNKRKKITRTIWEKEGFAVDLEVARKWDNISVQFGPISPIDRSGLEGVPSSHVPLDSVLTFN